MTKQGTKRKRAPPTKGPCEHGVKYRSKCKVCSACPHGKWRKLVQGVRWVSICEHGRLRSQCKECGGSQCLRARSWRSAVQGVRWVSICEHGRSALSARSAVGASICEHGRVRSQCKECGGSGICEHGRSQCSAVVHRSASTVARSARSAVVSICEHGRECGGGAICERSQCKECGGVCSNLRARSSTLSVQGVRWVSICEHGRQRSQCKECGGSQICEHGRRRTQCKECGGSQICEHGRRRYRCKECGGSRK